MLMCIFCTTTGADAYRPVTSIHKDICARLVKIELQGFDKRLIAQSHSRKLSYGNCNSLHMCIP